jgi:endoglucanase
MLRTRREINCLLLSSIHAANEVTAARPTTIGLRFGEGPESLQKELTPLGSEQDFSKASIKFFVNPNSGAAKWLRENANNPDAKYIRMIADNMHSMWLGKWNRRIANATANMLKQHAAQGAMPVFVLYNIPGRDNGVYSSGGEGSPEAYYEWVTAFGSALGDSDAIIILEPDALALSTTIGDEQNRAMRYALINTAIDILKKQAKAKVYIDAGHPNWHPAGEMADLLNKGGIRKTDGFFVNVSNFVDTAKCIDYGRSIAARTGGAHFVIDTSRNGRGAPADRGEYCNPSGVGLGHLPTVTTGEPLCDALLWIKVPGESDGPCNGGPNAGRFWPEYAIALAKNA